MADDVATTTESESGMDIEAAADQIGADLFAETRETAHPTDAVAEAIVTSEAPVKGPVATPPVTVAPTPDVAGPPKSWPKDMHPHWQTVPQPVRDYYQAREKQFLDGLEQYKGAAQAGKAIQDVLAPYQPLLQSKGLDAPRAIDDMLGAYTKLTQGTPEQRYGALMQIAQNLQIPMPTNGSTPQVPQPDPRLNTLETQFQQLQNVIQTQNREKATKEVNDFASDPAHALFDEVYEDLIRFLQQGDTLADAYDKAVWANPVTREKQVQARVQTETEKALERKRLDALPKQKARGVNVQSRDTERTPTDPLGSMEDTMRSTLKTIHERTTH